MKPNDANIHHYAGQLLFENGAFEDALCAFGDKPIILELHNIDVIMTKAKCKFLLGKFQEAADIMRELFNIPFHSDDVGVDIEVLILLECLANKVLSGLYRNKCSSRSKSSCKS